MDLEFRLTHLKDKKSSMHYAILSIMIFLNYTSRNTLIQSILPHQS